MYPVALQNRLRKEQVPAVLRNQPPKANIKLNTTVLVLHTVLAVETGHTNLVTQMRSHLPNLKVL